MSEASVTRTRLLAPASMGSTSRSAKALPVGR